MTSAVLVVDDSLTVRMSLMDLLKEAGLEAVGCETAAEARKALIHQRFALIILDVLLPDADGIDLLKEIRADTRTAGTAVMLLSSESEVRDRIRGLTTGADEYIGKPFDPNYLAARAWQLVRRNEDASGVGRDLILVIDDSLTYREALRGALEEAGYAVATADSGEDGLRLAAQVRPAAVIVDGVLPGIDGPSVIRKLRFDSALRGLPCLLLTMADEQEAELRALEAGADAFVRKSQDTEVVLVKLAAILRSAAAQGEQDQASLLGPQKILAVDDSETYLQALGEELRGDAYDVALARSGEEAMDLLAVQPVDCILLDIMMPGLGGLETCRQLKSIAFTRDTPIIMLTAMEDRETMIKGLGAGADDFISKSSDFAVLRARVAAQLRRKQFEDESRQTRQKLLHAELEAAEARAARELAEMRAELIEELELKNKELDAFSYSVAHDLRAPLRSIDGFSQALLEDYDEKLDDQGRQYLHYVRESAQHMAQLIDSLLGLSRVARTEFKPDSLDISSIAGSVIKRLRRQHPERRVEVVIADDMKGEGDSHLLTIVFDNLLGNAWKFTAKTPAAQIEIGSTEHEGRRAIFIRDNGAGFDMAYANKLFGVFQRLHSNNEFEGTGVGLATVQRIIRRHGGKVWATGAVGEGATFFFTLGAPSGALKEVAA